MMPLLPSLVAGRGWLRSGLPPEHFHLASPRGLGFLTARDTLTWQLKAPNVNAPMHRAL